MDRDERQHLLDQQRTVTRMKQEGKILSSDEWPRVGVVGEPRRMVEVCHDKAHTNVVVTVAGNSDMVGCGLRPSEARALSVYLTTAAAEVERRHGRQE